MPTIDPPSPLSDDELRWLAVKTAASLARLWARMEAFSVKPRPPMYILQARDLQPHEPWLDTVPPLTAYSGVQQAVVLAQGLLVHEATGSQAPSRRRMCRIVQHVSCGASVWSTHTLRLAQRLGIALAPVLRDETHGASLHNDIHLLDGTAEANRRQWAAAQRP